MPTLFALGLDITISNSTSKHLAWLHIAEMLVVQKI